MKHTLLFPLLSAAMLVSTPVFAGAGHDHGPNMVVSPARSLR